MLDSPGISQVSERLDPALLLNESIFSVGNGITSTGSVIDIITITNGAAWSIEF